jgi:hypothetical protein
VFTLPRITAASGFPLLEAAERVRSPRRFQVGGLRRFTSHSRVMLSAFLAV